jgi:CPA2 family monovalent cation:H+ antiporter-2
MDPVMVMLTSAVLAILIIGFLLHRLKQPYVVAYMIVGVIIGPYGLALVNDQLDLSRIGSIGVLLLLFFIGLPRLVANWRVAVIGTLLQILISRLLGALVSLHCSSGSLSKKSSKCLSGSYFGKITNFRCFALFWLSIPYRDI